MEAKEVLVIGAGISGCAVALALAKRQVPVTLIASCFDQRIYHASFNMNFDHLLEEQNPYSCPRAVEQLLSLAKKSVEELVGSEHLEEHNIDLHKKLYEQLKQFPHVEWINNHTVISLLTTESHSIRQIDIYKRPMCLGVYAYNHENEQVESILAKETVLATGGAAALYLHSTHSSLYRGEGLAMAEKAGVRLLNMEHIQFQPLTLFERDKPCYPLPVSLLEEGGKILNPLKAPIENICLNDLAPQLYREMIRSRAEHLWLDLTLLDSVVLKEKFPIVDVGCLSRGFNFAKDLLPIVPAAHSTCGGIAVDKVGQTSLHRLRALGEVSCTGLFYNFKAEEISVLESLTWSVACAEDIAKQIGKFVYYFPDVKEWNHSFETGQDNLIEEDWLLLKQIMWYYVGIERNKRHLKRGYALLQELKEQNERDASSFSMSKTRFLNALQTCLLIAKSSLQKSEEKEAVLSIQPAYSLN